MPGCASTDIDGLIVNRIPDYQRFCEIAGIGPEYVNITPGQGRFSGIDIETAAALIRDGLATTVALVYGNNGRSAGDRYGGAGDTYGSGGAGKWFPYGMTSPGAFHALMARRHMELYGTTRGSARHRVEDVPRSRRAQSRRAVMRKPFTLADYHASRYICEPLHLLDYCLINDGGVALILTTAERARDLQAAAGLCARLRHGDDARRLDVSARRFLARIDAQGVARRASAMAGVTHGGHLDA